MPRYDRQIILPEIGAEGQEKLSRAAVLCVGAGGLGAPALLYLAAAGVGHIGIIDFDTVDETNLQRQILFGTADIGQSKVRAAQKRLSALNPEVHITIFDTPLDAGNIEEVFSGYDIIIDGTDNFSAKFLINDAARKTAKPWVYGAVQGFDGQVAVFDSRKGPCYRCLYPAPPTEPVANCAAAGVLGAVVGIVGTAQALQVLYLILGRPALPPLAGKLWLMDCSSMMSRTLSIPQKENCKICHAHPADIILETTAAPPCTLIKEIGQREALALEEAVFIDVREKHELEDGMIPNALYLPLSRLKAEAARLPQAVPLVLYCQKGARSLAAGEILHAMGYTALFSLRGGFEGWQNQHRQNRISR